MTLFLALICIATHLHGMTGKSIVFVFPQTGLVCAHEPSQMEISFFDLDGNFKQKVMMEGVPANICEISGDLYLSLVIDDAEFELLVLNPNLSRTRRTKGITLYTPIFVNGKLFAMDYAKILDMNVKFPKLLQSFDEKSLTYGSESLLKLPAFIRNEQFAFPQFWGYDSAGGCQVIFNTWFNMLLLTKSYLERERIENESIETPAQLVQIKVKEDIKNPGRFTTKKLMLLEDYRRVAFEWYMNKTMIFSTWRTAKGIFIAYGDVRSNITKIGIINEFFDFTDLGRIPGRVIGGRENEVWTTLRDSEGVELRRLQIP